MLVKIIIIMIMYEWNVSIFQQRWTFIFLVEGGRKNYGFDGDLSIDFILRIFTGCLLHSVIQKNQSSKVFICPV